MLDESCSQIFMILDTLPNPVVLCELAHDDEGKAYDRLICVNQSFLNSMGYTLEDIPDDRSWLEKAYPDPDYRKHISAAWFSALERSSKEQSRMLGITAKIHCKDGKERWFNVTTQADYPIEKRYRTVVFLETHTPEENKLELERKSLELIKEHQLLHTIIDTVPIRIFWKDPDGVYLGCNKAFLDDAGLSHYDEIIGNTDFEMIWKDQAAIYRRDDREVFETGVPKLNYLETQIQEDGKVMMLSTSKVPLKDSKEKIVGTLGIYQDITQEYEAEQKLAENEKLMIAQSRLATMGEMLSIIAHEWKQPLSSISAIVSNVELEHALKILSLDDLNTRAKNISEIVLGLAQTIADFSDFFRPHVSKEEILLREPIDKALSIVDRFLEESEISVLLKHEEIRVQTYAKELQQVAIDIIKNAADALLKCDNSFRQISIASYADETSATIEISDNAGGIKEELLHRVFEPYFSTKLERNGKGLGLYMSKTIVEHHLKGKLSCENRNGGALFRITIPLDVE